MKTGAGDRPVGMVSLMTEIMYLRSWLGRSLASIAHHTNRSDDFHILY